MRRAFSLVELMVSMAIICLVAAIIFPVYARTRARAASSACVSHLRQVGTAVAEYTMDFDATAPVAGAYVVWGSPHGRTGPGWYERIYLYVEDVATFRCPGNSGAAFGYSMNGWTMSHVTEHAGTSLGLYHPDRAPSPAITPWVFDSCHPDSDRGGEATRLDAADCDPDNTDARLSLAPPRYSDLWFPGVHQGGNNVYFLDGHAKSWSAHPAGANPQAQLEYFQKLR